MLMLIGEKLGSRFRPRRPREQIRTAIRLRLADMRSKLSYSEDIRRVSTNQGVSRSLMRGDGPASSLIFQHSFWGSPE